MARKRMIDPTIWADEDFGNLSSEAQVLFIGMISNSDDEGRLPGNPVFLVSTIFPYRAFSEDDAKKLRGEVLKRMRSVKLYEKDGREYIQLSKFLQYQSIDRPSASKYPPLDDSSPSDNRTLVPNRREENRIEKNIHIRFTSFWNEYPKKAGKVIAERAFNRLNPSKTLFDKVLEDVRQRKQSEQWQKEKGKFILNPATYLNQRRWEDETKLPPKEKKPYYQGKEIRQDERGKWWVLHEGKRLEFAGKEEDIEYL